MTPAGVSARLTAAKTKHLSVRLVCLVGFTVVAGDATAHHAFSAEFDADAPVRVQGHVTKVEWINPHAWIHVAVTEDDGTITSWMFETGTPNTLVRAGVDKHTLPVGTELVVRGYQSKDKNCIPACKANGRDLAFSNGHKVFVGGNAPQDGLD